MLNSDIFETISKITARVKGILAADESTPTIEKRFKSINIESTEHTRCKYRELLFTTPKLEKYISGVILFEETFTQAASNGKQLPQILIDKGILPGIKVDKGTTPLANTSELTTQGLDGLGERIEKFKAMGAKFAKWRSIYKI